MYEDNDTCQVCHQGAFNAMYDNMVTKSQPDDNTYDDNRVTN